MRDSFITKISIVGSIFLILPSLATPNHHPICPVYGKKIFLAIPSWFPNPSVGMGSGGFDLAKPIHGPRTTPPTEANAAELMCFPMGLPGTYYRPRPFELVQLPNRIVMVFEVNNFWGNDLYGWTRVSRVAIT
ncbi:MAG: hypothetical protein CM1200mP36_07500 [Gammaproteobacteria bacterium]|nr:MAG: hypothetical protein CM1200mP36_07500 [Gammaproteobacteria bacterium]